MKNKVAGFIVRYRIIIMILLLVLAVWSVFQIGRTRINYDLTRYLDEDTMTKRALQVMTDEFGSSEQLRIAFMDQEEDAVQSCMGKLSAMEEILAVRHDPETDVAVRDGKTFRLVTLTLNDCDAEALVARLRTMFPEAGEYLVGGSAAQQLDVQRSVGAEIPVVMIIAVAVVLLVLLLTSHAWLEPLVLLAVFAVSILINMGTNFLFADVSFITFSVCAILQLALSIDYAIMLLHTWNGLCDDGLDPESAMVRALSECFMRIASSALTTVAGLLSLLFMSFTIGFDIGMVLSKGILISMLCVFLLMPALTLLLKGLLRRTRHKPIPLGGEKLGAWIWKARKPVAALLVLLVACGAVLSGMNTYTFTGPDVTGETESSRITSLFGASNPLVLLVPGGEEDDDYDRQRELVQRLTALTREDGSPVLKDVTAMVTVGSAALEYYTVSDVADLTGLGKGAVSLFFMMNGFGDSVRADRLLAAAESLSVGSDAITELSRQLETAREAFIGKTHHRMLLEPAFSVTDEDFSSCMSSILSAAKASYGADYYVTGGPMSTYDIGNAFRGDLMKVNIITLLAILLIVMLSFRSLFLPLLLVFVIEGAIWVTMGISRIIGEPIFFISYLICLSIQMGATIDYGILVCDQYRMLRRGGASPQEAVKAALKKALPTVLTSGIILITAGGIIGLQCSIYYISSIGLLLSRGALMSVLLVLTLLPALLVLLDRFILRKAPRKAAAE